MKRKRIGDKKRLERNGLDEGIQYDPNKTWKFLLRCAISFKVDIIRPEKSIFWQQNKKNRNSSEIKDKFPTGELFIEFDQNDHGKLAS